MSTSLGGALYSSGIPYSEVRRIVHVIDHLPEYEAVVDALDGLLGAMTDDGTPLDGSASWYLVHAQLREARAVLRRLRGDA